MKKKMYETDRLDSKWVSSLNRADEIWVPSHFNLETFVKSGVKREKVHVIGESVDATFFDPFSTVPLNLLDYYKSTSPKDPFMETRHKPFVFLRSKLLNF